ncbi:MAG: hypothetical protein IJE77_12880 [Thermoguttaceae bacterium]|nr:hypothetical protein [Thermoguttaceae bacterium]
MKRNALILFFATFTFLAFGDVANVRRSLAAELQTPPAKTAAKTDANVARQEFASLAKDGALRTRAAFYPTELAFGDVGYFATFERNVGDETFSPYAPFEFELAKYIDLGAITLTSPDVPGRYEIAPELATRRFFVKKIGFRLREIPPGVERRKVAVALEFPPLEDWNAPFWASVRDKLSHQNAVELRLRVEFSRSEADYPFRVDEAFETSLVLKRRPQNELERLARWFDATPANLFPERFPNGDGAVVKAPSSKGTPDLVSSGANDVEIGGKSHDPWLFVRPGFRKPSDPNAPTTVDGWRRLETEFAPSTLRDEITLTRLQLEYYDAPEGTESDAALQALVAWLEKRPEPQRVILSQSIRSKHGRLYETPLKEKSAALCKALAPLSTSQTLAPNDAK